MSVALNPSLIPAETQQLLNTINNVDTFQKKYLATLQSIFYKTLMTSELQQGTNEFQNVYSNFFSVSVLDMAFDSGMGDEPLTGTEVKHNKINTTISRHEYRLDSFRSGEFELPDTSIDWSNTSVAQVLLTFLEQRYYYEIDRATVASFLNIAKNAVDFQYNPVDNAFQLTSTESDALYQNGNPVVWKDIAEKRFLDNHVNLANGTKRIWMNASVYKNFLSLNGTYTEGSAALRILESNAKSFDRNIQSFDGYEITKLPDDVMIGGYIIDSSTGQFSEDTTKGRIGMVVFADQSKVIRPMAFHSLKIIPSLKNVNGWYTLLAMRIFYGVIVPLYQSSSYVLFQYPAPTEEELGSETLKIREQRVTNALLNEDNGGSVSAEKNIYGNYGMWKARRRQYLNQLKAQGKINKNETLEDYLARKNVELGKKFNKPNVVKTSQEERTNQLAESIIENNKSIKTSISKIADALAKK